MSSQATVLPVLQAGGDTLAADPSSQAVVGFTRTRFLGRSLTAPTTAAPSFCEASRSATSARTAEPSKTKDTATRSPCLASSGRSLRLSSGLEILTRRVKLPKGALRGHSRTTGSPLPAVSTAVDRHAWRAAGSSVRCHGRHVNVFVRYGALRGEPSGTRTCDVSHGSLM